MTRAIVITRPQAQAGELAQRLQDAGHAVVMFPLLEIHALADPAPLKAILARLDEFALVAFVSPNAIDATFAHVDRWPESVPLAVMGEGSRRTLMHHGVTPERYQITSPLDTRRTDSQTLLKVLKLDALRGRRVLILRGETGRELLGDALRGAGIEVLQVAAYRRAAPVLTPALADQLRMLLASDDSWIITSSEALQVVLGFAKAVDPEFGVVKLQQKNIFVPHQRIWETAQTLGFRHVCLTDAGDDGLFTALQLRP
ncbi:uroporphyrinogen-III synthase [Actimicrobium antarcticum]|uniref:Uroporphyrinogen-III synthase n=1 Tax=Actimicrobium antarcticum TaxID=1051899 RepID=A0ABP7SVK3_9BURK